MNIKIAEACSKLILFHEKGGLNYSNVQKRDNKRTNIFEFMDFLLLKNSSGDFPTGKLAMPICRNLFSEFWNVQKLLCFTDIEYCRWSRPEFLIVRWCFSDNWYYHHLSGSSGASGVWQLLVSSGPAVPLHPGIPDRHRGDHLHRGLLRMLRGHQGKLLHDIDGRSLYSST